MTELLASTDAPGRRHLGPGWDAGFGERVPREVHERAEEFLFHEAQLMDDSRYDDWLALWHPADARYWVPCDGPGQDPRRELSIIYDDRAGLANRIARLRTGLVHSQSPPSQMVRIVGNVVVRANADGILLVRSTFVLVASRAGRKETFGGSAQHVLLPDPARPDGSVLAVKKVILVDNDQPLPPMTFLL